jgi:hypothetical protein
VAGISANGRVHEEGHYEMTTEMPEDEKPVVRLVGTDGNAFAIMGKVARALRQAGKPELVKRYMDEATSGDYDHLLQVTMKYVDVR